MLILKLQRTGKKHQASFRLVAGEKRHKMSGKQVEYLGWYNPQAHAMEFKKERVLYWLKNGAQKTDTVHNLLISSGIIEGKKIAVHKKKKTGGEAVTTPAAAENKNPS